MNTTHEKTEPMTTPPFPTGTYMLDRTDGNYYHDGKAIKPATWWAAVKWAICNLPGCKIADHSGALIYKIQTT